MHAAIPAASHTYAWCCLPHSIPVLPTTKQHLAADYQAPSRCCRLPPSSTPVLPTNNLPPASRCCPRPTCPQLQHLSAAYPAASWCCPLPTCLLLHVEPRIVVLLTNNLPTASQCCLLTACLPHLGAPADAMPPTAEAVSDHRKRIFFLFSFIIATKSRFRYPQRTIKV